MKQILLRCSTDGIINIPKDTFKELKWNINDNITIMVDEVINNKIVEYKFLRIVRASDIEKEIIEIVSIKYEKEKHDKERITRFLDSIDMEWILGEFKRMKMYGIEPYLVKSNNKVAICHKGWKPFPPEYLKR